MFIEQLHIQNFKGIKNKTLDFRERFTVLIGDNGSGKTAVLDALAVAAGAYLLGIDEANSRHIHKDEIRRESYNTNVEYQLPVSIQATGMVGGEHLSWARSLKKLHGKTTRIKARDVIGLARRNGDAVRKNDPVKLPVICYHGTGRLWMEYYRRVNYKTEGSRMEQGYYACLLPKSSSKEFLSWYKTFEDEALKFGKDRELLEAFNAAIIRCVPEWTKISFSFKEDDLMGLYEAPGEAPVWMPLRLLSDGFRGIIGLIADIAYRCIKLNPHLGENAIRETKGLVLVDELDLHLHPKWQKRIVYDLKKTFPGIQFIATTHSPFIIQSLKREELINLNRETGEDPFRKSIEEIAETEMEVPEVERSQRFQEMVATAEEYYKMIRAKKSSKEDSKVKELKEKLDIMQEKFSDDPAYVALLKAERKTEMQE